MKIEVMEYRFSPSRMRMAIVLVRYEELILRCELVLNKKDARLWIRMPEIWITSEIKRRFCFFSSKMSSDDFQSVVLCQLLHNHNVTLTEIVKMHRDYMKKQKRALHN